MINKVVTLVKIRYLVTQSYRRFRSTRCYGQSNISATDSLNKLTQEIKYNKKRQ